MKSGGGLFQSGPVARVGDAPSRRVPFSRVAPHVEPGEPASRRACERSAASQAVVHRRRDPVEADAVRPEVVQLRIERPHGDRTHEIPAEVEVVVRPETQTPAAEEPSRAVLLIRDVRIRQDPVGIEQEPKVADFVTRTGRDERGIPDPGARALTGIDLQAIAGHGRRRRVVLEVVGVRSLEEVGTGALGRGNRRRRAADVAGREGAEHRPYAIHCLGSKV